MTDELYVLMAENAARLKAGCLESKPKNNFRKMQEKKREDN